MLECLRAAAEATHAATRWPVPEILQHRRAARARALGKLRRCQVRATPIGRGQAADAAGAAPLAALRGRGRSRGQNLGIL